MNLVHVNVRAEFQLRQRVDTPTQLQIDVLAVKIEGKVKHIIIFVNLILAEAKR